MSFLTQHANLPSSIISSPSMVLSFVEVFTLLRSTGAPETVGLAVPCWGKLWNHVYQSLLPCSHQSVHQMCHTNVSYKCVIQMCRTNVSYKCVIQMCPPNVYGSMGQGMSVVYGRHSYRWQCTHMKFWTRLGIRARWAGRWGRCGLWGVWCSYILLTGLVDII